VSKSAGRWERKSIRRLMLLRAALPNFWSPVSCEAAD